LAKKIKLAAKHAQAEILGKKLFFIIHSTFEMQILQKVILACIFPIFRINLLKFSKTVMS